MYTIEKTFTGDVAHRIHNQCLDADYTEGHSVIPKCRRLHGHTFELKVKFGSDTLLDDMVLDYNEMGFVKNFINDVLDHRTLLSMNDPWLAKIIVPLYQLHSGKSITYTDSIRWICKFINTSDINDTDIKEFFDSFSLVNFTTSSEHISEWLHRIVSGVVHVYNAKHRTNIRVISVSYKETPKSEAVYCE